MRRPSMKVAKYAGTIERVPQYMGTINMFGLLEFAGCSIGTWGNRSPMPSLQRDHSESPSTLH